MLQGYGLCGLTVGADYFVGGLPVEVERACRTGVGSQCGGAAVDDDAGLSSGCGVGSGINGNGLCTRAGAVAAANAYGVGHLEVAGLGIGVADGLSAACLSVTEVPLVTADGLASRCGGSAGELCRSAFTDRVIGEVRRGLSKHLDALRDLTGAVAATAYVKCHLVSAWVGIGVCGVRSSPSLPVAEVPLVALDGLSRWVSGGSTGELGGVANAHRGEVEVGSGLGVNHHGFSGGAVGLRAHGDGAGVDTCHIQGAVRTGGVLQVGVESARTSPMVGGASLALCRQMDGLTDTVRTAAADQGGQDAAVGSTGADV